MMPRNKRIPLDKISINYPVSSISGARFETSLSELSELERKTLTGGIKTFVSVGDMPESVKHTQFKHLVYLDEPVYAIVDRRYIAEVLKKNKYAKVVDLSKGNESQYCPVSPKYFSSVRREK